MDASTDFVVEFVAPGNSAAEWQMVLVEQGPWTDVTRELLRFQERLYDGIDTLLDGLVAAKFPASKGARFLLRVECHNLPQAEVSAFFQRFSNGIFSDGDYRIALDRHDYVADITFAIAFDPKP
jgi:hypothetical protein